VTFIGAACGARCRSVFTDVSGGESRRRPRNRSSISAGSYVSGPTAHQADLSRAVPPGVRPADCLAKTRAYSGSTGRMRGSTGVPPRTSPLSSTTEGIKLFLAARSVLRARVGALRFQDRLPVSASDGRLVGTRRRVLGWAGTGRASAIRLRPWLESPRASRMPQPRSSVRPRMRERHLYRRRPHRFMGERFAPACAGRIRKDRRSCESPRRSREGELRVDCCSTPRRDRHRSTRTLWRQRQHETLDRCSEILIAVLLGGLTR
jgi:hypothetical protein